MHKDTVEAIQSVLSVFDRRNGNNACFRIFVMRQSSGGFWQLCVVADENKEYFLPHIQGIGCAIGRMFGENLYADLKGDRLVLS